MTTLRWCKTAWGWRRHLFEEVLKDTSGRHAPQMLRLRYLLPLITVLGAAFVWFVFAGLARLQGLRLSWWWPHNGALKGANVYDLGRTTAAMAALLGGIFALAYAYRKQRVEEAAGRRADEENLRERNEARSKRYQDAAGQLGHENAAVRLAGVYAMASLADEWPEQRQTCADVLCAYLRMQPDAKQREDVEVRRSIVRAFRSRLIAAASSDIAWWRLEFDFTGASFDRVDFSGAIFIARPVFTQAMFTGRCNLDHAHFFRGADFAEVEVREGELSLQFINLYQGNLELERSKILRRGALNLRVTMRQQGAQVDAGSLEVVAGELRVHATGA